MAKRVQMNDFIYKLSQSSLTFYTKFYENTYICLYHVYQTDLGLENKSSQIINNERNMWPFPLLWLGYMARIMADTLTITLVFVKKISGSTPHFIWLVTVSPRWKKGLDHLAWIQWLKPVIIHVITPHVCDVSGVIVLTSFLCPSVCLCVCLGLLRVHYAPLHWYMGYLCTMVHIAAWWCILRPDGAQGPHIPPKQKIIRVPWIFQKI